MDGGVGEGDGVWVWVWVEVEVEARCAGVVWMGGGEGGGEDAVVRAMPW